MRRLPAHASPTPGRAQSLAQSRQDTAPTQSPGARLTHQQRDSTEHSITIAPPSVQLGWHVPCVTTVDGKLKFFSQQTFGLQYCALVGPRGPQRSRGM